MPSTAIDRVSQSQVYQATTMRTDVVHCRESVGTGPAVLKVVPVTDAAFSSRVTWLLLFFYIYVLVRPRLGTNTITGV